MLADAKPATRANQLAKALIRERPNIVLIKFNTKFQWIMLELQDIIEHGNVVLKNFPIIKKL
jgi:hypothetical protein